MVFLGVFLAHLVGADAFFLAALDDLVVDVRDVPHILDLVTLVAQEAHHDIGHHRGAAVAQMSQPVHRGPATVDPATAGLEGLEGLLVAGHRVVQVDGVLGRLCHGFHLFIRRSVQVEEKI
jgi:hypothetical protein